MSKKTRTEEQKARRAYLEWCKKEGKKPLDIETWKSTLAKKAKDAIKKGDFKSKTLKIVKVAKKPTAKPAAKKQPAKKVAKPAQKKEVSKVLKPKVHVVRKGDIIKFEDFSPFRVLDYALKLACVSWAEAKKFSSCPKKCK